MALPCIVCQDEIGANSVGDHLIPLSIGGPVGAQNYLPLCKRCNSSKGRQDLLIWWLKSGRRMSDLPPDVLCAYARLQYQWSASRLRLDDEAPDTWAEAVRRLVESLPTEGHRSYWRERLGYP